MININRYLITGASGFIGKSLLKRLSGVDVLIVGREWHSDISLPSKIKQFNPTHIVHCAAEIKNQSDCFKSNVLMTQWLLEATQDVDYKAFVNIGTSSEYGSKLEPMREVDVLSPRTMYEATKAACTMLCQGFARYYNKPIVTVRPFSVYGEYEPAARLIPTLFRNFENNQPSQISLGVHDFIHIDDFLDGVMLILHSPSNIIQGDVVHLGNGVQHTNVEVFQIIKELYQSTASYQDIDNNFNTYDTLNWVADTTYAKSKYGFKPKYNLTTGLRQVYETRNTKA